MAMLVQVQSFPSIGLSTYTHAMNDHAPVFVVGCSRSGTTLLQSIIATNSDFFAFPEASVLFRVADDLTLRRYGPSLIAPSSVRRMRAKAWLNRIGLTRGFDWRSHLHKMPELFSHAVASRDLSREYRIKTVFRQFREIVERGAGSRRWIEKSPNNIYVLDYLERYFKDAKFVHIVRSQYANIASIIDAAGKYESFRTRFAGEFGLERAVAYYNSALRCSAMRRRSSRHFIVRYEELVNHTDVHLRRLEQFLSAPQYSFQAIYDVSNIAHDTEVWKNHGRQIGAATDKSREVFTPAQHDFIKHHALNPDNWFPRCAAA